MHFWSAITSVYKEKGDVEAERKAQRAFNHAYQSRLAMQFRSIPGHAIINADQQFG